MATPSPGAPEPEPQRTMTEPGPVPLAYRLLESAQNAITDHHQLCAAMPGLWRDQPVALRFSHDHDDLGIVVWTQMPGCLMAEMAERDCHFDGVSLLAQYAEDSRCPGTAAALLASWGIAS